jgi:transcriptional regulator with XRE-family HTH domain
MGLNVPSENNNQQRDLQKLAENLGALLKSHHLNPNQLAQVLGIPMMTIRRLLLGETTDPRISTLKLIADYFKVSIDFLIEGDEQSISNSRIKSKLHFVPKLSWDIVK